MHRGTKIGSYVIMYRGIIYRVIKTGSCIYMEQGHYAQRDENRQLGNHAQKHSTWMNQDWQLYNCAQSRYAQGDQDMQSCLHETG